MKIKLTKPAGFLTSAKHVVIESALVDTIEDNGDTRKVTLSNGQSFDVVESVDKITELTNPITPKETTKPSEQANG